jgi:hypothetical protein
MPSLELNGRLIYFAHCPKAGGTSVERFMVERWGSAVGLLGWGWDRRGARRGERAGEIPSSPQHLRLGGCAARPAAGAGPCVHGGAGPGGADGERVSLPAGGAADGAVRAAGSRAGFAAWLRLMFAMADRNPYTHDNHFRPQVDFLPPTGVTVFRLEDGLGAGPELACGACRASRSPETPPHDLKTAGARVVPSADDKALISMRFREDYLRFGYAAPETAESAGMHGSGALRAVAAAARSAVPEGARLTTVRWGRASFTLL